VWVRLLIGLRSSFTSGTLSGVPRGRTVFYKQGHFWGAFGTAFAAVIGGISFGSSNPLVAHLLLVVFFLAATCTLSIILKYYGCRARFWIISTVAIAIGAYFIDRKATYIEHPNLIEHAFAATGMHPAGDKFGGFEWNPQFVETRLLVSNAGAVSQNLSVHVHTDLAFHHVTEISGMAGCSERLLSDGSVLLYGKDTNNNPTVVDATTAVVSTDAEITCSILKRAQSIEILLAVGPKHPIFPVPKHPPLLDPPETRTLPKSLRVQISFDERNSSGGLKTITQPESSVAVTRLPDNQSGVKSQ
jgi:hypothetical protein